MTEQQRSDLVGIGRWVVSGLFALLGTAFWIVPMVVFQKTTALDKLLCVLCWFFAAGVVDFPILHDFFETVGDFAVKIKDILVAWITRGKAGA